MLHPVLPPAPLPALEPVQSANSIAYVSKPQFHSVVETHTVTQEPQRETPQISNVGESEGSLHLSIPINATKDNLVSAKTLATPSTPETFPAEFSPLTKSRQKAYSSQGSEGKQSANLGQVASLDAEKTPMTLLAPLTMPASAPLFQGRDELTASKSAANLGQPQKVGHSMQQVDQPKTIPTGQVVAQQVTPQTQQIPESINLIGDNPDYVPSSQPVQNTIEFKSRNSTNETSTPTTIEFQSPTPQAQQPTPTPPVRERIVEVISDKQEYDEQRRIITAEGNVVVRFDGAVVDADRLQVNLDNLIAVGEGNVALTRGDQILRGQRFTYNFIQDSGELENGSGEIFVPSAQTDLAFTPNELTAGGVPPRPLSDRVRANQPLTGISSPGGIDFTTGGTAGASNVPAPTAGGEVRRLRFEAERIEFYPRGWQAENVRITNDPFSPPELELRASKVTSTRESPLVETITTRGQRLVFDQKFTLPIPVDRQTIDRFERDASPFIVSPGFDGDRRGGLFVERGFTAIDNEQTRLRITPQLFVQKAFQEGTSDVAALFGVTTRLNAVLSPRATLQGAGELTSFDLNKVDENLRASLRLRQELGDINPHILNLEYSYRDRLYNDSLGFQTVQSSIGGLISSPVIPIGDSGVNLRYQAGAQYINANTDRLDLLEPDRANDRISLGRLQGSASLSRGFLLWQGKPLPPTATKGLRYTPNPVVPYLQTFASITGTTSHYTNGDNQSTLTGTVGLVGQIGHFSRPYLDYTAFNVSYSQGLNSGLSPFLFDRSVDNKVLSAGISQQIYGPFRLGFQTSINLDTGRETSTDYILEYSRRTYGITLRYNPVLELGGFSIRISDFNWTGGTDPFSGGEVRPVVDGVRQDN
ncbi:MAG: DUF3769 domain-containing protein [Trichormus sp. ATA11-4-KO1]|jgi:hypothetical protein|nr:DUF3769 domain-containing protein [Trichormus sp. ATA11-4-KO1]